MGKKDLEWISSHREEVEKFTGKWIAVLNGKILATGDSVSNVMEVVRGKHIKGLPLVTKVPRRDEEMYIL